MSNQPQRNFGTLVATIGGIVGILVGCTTLLTYVTGAKDVPDLREKARQGQVMQSGANSKSSIPEESQPPSEQNVPQQNSPISLTGSWEGTASDGNNNDLYKVTLTQDGMRITGEAKVTGQRDITATIRGRVEEGTNVTLHIEQFASTSGNSKPVDLRWLFPEVLQLKDDKLYGVRSGLANFHLELTRQL